MTCEKVLQKGHEVLRDLSESCGHGGILIQITEANPHRAVNKQNAGASKLWTLREYPVKTCVTYVLSIYYGSARLLSSKYLIAKTSVFFRVESIFCSILHPEYRAEVKLSKTFTALLTLACLRSTQLS